eukprot:gb/GECG01011836.1/.p1 GENE.gb/GECG01011836.1/~~gb/GECG01011836.1/.p1  ORF type:complete len:174 (+),score=12.88 gb/GECG01011836.1/:1-522(+)
MSENRQWCLRHALRSSCQNDFRSIQDDILGSIDNSLEATSTQAVDRQCSSILVHATSQPHMTGDVRSIMRSLSYIPDDAGLDVRWVNLHSMSTRSSGSELHASRSESHILQHRQWWLGPNGRPNRWRRTLLVCLQTSQKESASPPPSKSLSEATLYVYDTNTRMQSDSLKESG